MTQNTERQPFFDEDEREALHTWARLTRVSAGVFFEVPEGDERDRMCLELYGLAEESLPPCGFGFGDIMAVRFDTPYGDISITFTNHDINRIATMAIERAAEMARERAVEGGLPPSKARLIHAFREWDLALKRLDATEWIDCPALDAIAEIIS